MKKKNILIIGSGGREHALVWKVAQSKQVNHIFVAPGNGGTATMDNVTNIAVAATDCDGLLAFAQQQNIDLTIIGPEIPLAAGIVDLFQATGIACIGPTQAAAQLESSKKFAKDFMQKHNIPTANYCVVTNIEDATNYIHSHLAKTNSSPLVIKANGLAAGKGVVIAHDKEEALKTVQQMLCEDTFGAAGNTVIFEEFLHGIEVSYIVLSDGVNYIPLATAQDYKARDTGNTGPNTGGMGSFSPSPFITQELEKTITKNIVEPILTGMGKRGTPFTGFLFIGLMITPEGIPKVLEFNCRLGDPETQSILLRMETDFVKLCFAALEKRLNNFKIEWDSRKAVTVVIADGDYPYKKTVGQPITINSQSKNDVIVFHAGTKYNNKQLVSSGGRILNVTGLANSLENAREKVYKQIESIHLPHMYYRKDIAENS